METPTPDASPSSNNLECTMAIISIVCAGLSFFFGFLTALPAVVCGHLALGDIRRNPDKYKSSSKTMSIIGLVLGYIILGLTVLMILMFVLIFLGQGL